MTESILFLVHRIPYPPNKGDKIRSYHFLKALAERYQVYCGCFIDDGDDWQYQQQVEALCAESHFLKLQPRLAKLKSAKGLLIGTALSIPYYHNPQMQVWVDKVISEQKISKVLIFSSVMAQYVVDKNLQLVADFVDVDSDKWRQYAEKKQGLGRWVYQREAKTLLTYERSIAAKTQATTFVSKAEVALFQSLAPEVAEKIDAINNGVDSDYFSVEHNFTSPYLAEQTVIVFTGAMDYWANVDAVVWYAQQVFPLVKQQNPNILFYIVGSKPSPEVLELAELDGIEVTGFVDDVRPYIAHAKLVVAPLRIARGIQNKVLEAMAMQKTVLATTAAMEGIGVNDSLAVFIEDEAEQFAIRNLELLAEMDLNSVKNRVFVEDEFTWSANTQKLLALIDSHD